MRTTRKTWLFWRLIASFFVLVVGEGLAQGQTARVSVDSAGLQANAQSEGYSAVSENGRYVVFKSWASNLVPGDTNWSPDIFVRDLQSGTTTRVSVSSSGVEGNSTSTHPAISANGRHVAFKSWADNLVSGGTNAALHVFVRDLQSGTTTLASVSSSGEQGNGTSGETPPSISGDGRYVAFESQASNLVPGDTNGLQDIFVRDLQGGTTTRVSVSSSGGEGNGFSLYPSISGDGRYLAFISWASNLVDGDTNNTTDVFVHDLQTKTTTRVSLGPGGAQANGGSFDCSISGDGRYVAFSTAASNLAAGDGNYVYDVIVHDRQTGVNALVSVAAGGGAANGDSQMCSISGDGRYVAFMSRASNLVAGDTSPNQDIFVRDRATGETIRCSVSSSGEESNNDSAFPAISGDGGTVAFFSWASNLVAGDTNGVGDIFAHSATTTMEIVAGPTSTEVTPSAATISWATSQPSDSTVRYSVKTDLFDQVVTDATLTTSHTVRLTDLESNRVYQYVVESTNAAGDRVASRSGYFLTPSVPDGIDPQLRSLAPTTRHFPPQFTADPLDASQIVKVEFYLDGRLVETSFAAPFSMSLDPVRLGMTRAEFLKPHDIRAVAYDEGGITSEGIYAYQPPPVCAIAELDFVLPEDPYVIRTEVPAVPPGNSFDIHVDASERDWINHCCRECMPPRCENIGKAVARIEVWLDNVLCGQATETTELAGSCDPAGLALGDHTLVARAYGHDCLYPRTEARVVRVQGPETNVEASRTVTQEGNYLRVTWRVGPPTMTPVATVLSLTDNLTGFHVLPDAGSPYAPQRHWDVETKTTRVTFDFGGGVGLSDGESVQVSYLAVPVLYPGFDNYSIGSEPYELLFTDWQGVSHSHSHSARRDGSFRDTVNQAIEAADYLLVTNPHNLLIANAEGNVLHLLDKMAELAVLKSGVLGYYRSRATLPTSFDSSDRLATGDVYGDGVAIVIAQDEDDAILLYTVSRSESINLKNNTPSVEVNEGDALAVGNVWGQYVGAADNHPADEILLVKGSGADSGRVFACQYDDRGIYHFDCYWLTNNIGYEPGDGFAAAEFFDDAGYDCEPGTICPAALEMVLAHQGDGTIEIFDQFRKAPWSVRVSFRSVFTRGDALAVGDILGDDKDEIIVGHRADGQIYIYAPDSTLLANYPAGFQAGEKLAVGDVVWGPKKDIVIIDPDSDRFRILFHAGGLILWEDASYSIPFNAPDGLAVCNLQGRAKDQIITACGRRSEGRAEGEVAIYTESEISATGDRVGLDDLIDEDGEWAIKLGADWAVSGYLLIVGETEIIPAWGGQEWKLRDIFGRVVQTLKTTCTDYPYASASTEAQETKPDLVVGRIVGNNALELAGVIDTAIQVHRGTAGYGFDGSHAYLASGFTRCLHGGCAYSDFASRRVRASRILVDKGLACMIIHFPDHVVFDPPDSDFLDQDATIAAIQTSIFRNIVDRDLVFLAAHGSPDGLDTSILTSSTILDAASPVFGSTNPVVVACSCVTGRYPYHTSLAESFLQERAGVYIGATEVSYGPNEDAIMDLLRDWVPGKSAGKALRDVKRNLSGEAYDRYFSAIYHHYGDAKFGTAGLGAAGAAARSLRAEAQALSFVQFTVPDYEVAEIEGGHRVDIPGGRRLCLPGLPAVPYYRVTYEYPANHVIQNVKLVDRSGLRRDQGPVIPACTLEVFQGGGNAPEDGPSLPEWWPRRAFEWETFRNDQGGQTLAITVYPFDYNSQTTGVEFYPTWSFQVDYAVSELQASRLKLTKRVYEPGETVEANLLLSIGGDQAVDLIVESVIKSLNDEIVAGLPLKLLGGVKGLVRFRQTWTSQNASPAYYVWELRVKKSDGTLLGRAYRTFLLGAAVGEITDFSVSPENFQVGDDVILSATVRNTGSRELDGTIAIKVQDRAKHDIAVFEGTFSGLQPNQSFVFNPTWSKASLAFQDCRLMAYVSFDGRVAAVQVLEQQAVLRGDVDFNNVLDLQDAIKALQFLVGAHSSEIYPQADVNGDGRIGMEDILYILQVLSQLRE